MNRLWRGLRGFLVALALVFGLRTASGQAAAPITLDEAIAGARAHHPRMAEAQAAEEQAQSARRAAASGRLPVIAASEEAVYSDDPVFAFGSKLRQGRFASSDFDLNTLNHPAALSNFDASVNVSWTAFDGGATRSKVASANSSLWAAVLETQYAGEQVAESVTTLYYRVLMAEEQIAVANAALQRAQEIAADVEDRVHAGLALESDGARARLALQDAQNDAAAAHEHVQLARTDFFDLIGEPNSDQPLVRPEVKALPSGDAAASDALAQRFDLQALRMEQQSARQQLTSIKASAWPAISAYGHVENDSEHLATGGSGNWAVGAKIELSVFDSGLRRAREQEAAANLHRLAAQERSTLLEANANIAALKALMVDLHRRLTTAESAVRVEQDALQTTRDRYASGLVSITEVLSGESQLTAAEFQRVRLFYQLCMAKADLALADGQQATSKAGQ